MTKPRWIDTGVFRTLRTATRARRLAVVVGPRHGSAALSTRNELKQALADGDRAALADDARFRSRADAGLAALFTLRQPGIVTTAVSDALEASAPEEVAEGLRVLGPDSKGLRGAWDRKDTFVAHLLGRAAEASTLVLTEKERKALVGPDSRYQGFLRATFSRTVLFTGFDLGDPDLSALLDDVSRCFNGHVPANIALVQAGTTDPATALRASMHYGMTVVEFPAELRPSDALAEVARTLEDLEVPKPATGNPPPGSTEIDQRFRESVPQASPVALQRFDEGDSGDWALLRAGVDAPRSAAAAITDFLLGDTAGGMVRVAVVRGHAGEGKSTLLRRLAWDLSSRDKLLRVFWRETGAGLPEDYVPAEAEGARAVFVADDADELVNLPGLLRNLAARGGGKARLLLASDSERWERSGMDHRVRQHTELHEVVLAAPDEAEARALADSLVRRGRVTDVGAAAARIQQSEGVLLERLAAACGAGSIRERVASELQRMTGLPEGALLKRAWLAVALVHRHAMALAPEHLAQLVGVPAAELPARVLKPLGGMVVQVASGALRTPHPVVASAATEALAPDEGERDLLIVDLLRSLTGTSVADHTVLCAPSELIRARRHAPLPPLTLGRFFEAGEDAARNDVHFWFDRGRYESDFSRWEPALAAFDQALWKQPGDASQREHNALVHANRARCLSSLGRKREALAAIEDGLRHSPRDTTLLRQQEKLGGRRPPRGRGREGERGGERGERGGRGGRGAGGGPGGDRRPRGRAPAGAGRRGPPGPGGRPPA